jgi:phosphoribosyl-ATP pyrophosphohydrolase
MPRTIMELEDLLRERRADKPPGSYTAELFNAPERIQRKVMEEAFEVCLELGRPRRDAERIVSEAADLVFHLLVGLVDADLSFEAVVGELARRRR